MKNHIAKEPPLCSEKSMKSEEKSKHFYEHKNTVLCSIENLNVYLHTYSLYTRLHTQLMYLFM